MSTAIIVPALVLAGVWDLYAIHRWGLQGGKTLSWVTYTESKNWPILAFLVGYAAHGLTCGLEIPFVFALVLGHIFGTMRGA